MIHVQALYQSKDFCSIRGLETIMHTHFPEDVAYVGFNGIYGYVLEGSDFIIIAASNH